MATTSNTEQTAIDLPAQPAATPTSAPTSYDAGTLHTPGPVDPDASPAEDALARLEQCWHLEQHLEQEMADAVAAARAAGLSWDKIGTALRRARQVVHARFSTAANTEKEIALPGLAQAGGRAIYQIRAQEGIGKVEATLPVAGKEITILAGGPDLTWTVSRDGDRVDATAATQLLSAIPVGVRHELEQAARSAQRIASIRQVAIEKRLATIAEHNIPVGRPSKARRPID